MRAAKARLLLADDRSKRTLLDPAQPLTIGRAAANRLRLVSVGGVSEHHAVVRFSRQHGWLVCDWQSSDGTFLEGQRVRQCRPLNDGDEIRLGAQGPVLVFELIEAEPRAAGGSGTTDEPLAGNRSAEPRGGAAAGGAAAGGRNAAAAGSGAPAPRRAAAAAGTSLEFDGTVIRLDLIRSAMVISEPRHPHIFSWWLLLCLGGLLLLPFPLVFWPLQISALAGWILLGARKEHTLMVTLHDGQALRRGFANKVTALAHRNGIRKAIGQSLQQN